MHRPAGKQGRAPMRFDLVGAIAEHALDDDFWRERSPFWRLARDQGAGALDRPLGQDGPAPARQHPRLRGRDNAPKKLVVTGAKNVHEAHHQYDQIEFHEKELLPFYDAHLKGIDNGFMDGPPVRLFVRGANVWRDEERVAAASARPTCRCICARGRPAA